MTKETKEQVREIKFRAWCISEKEMIYPKNRKERDFIAWNIFIQPDDNYVGLQFTGLKDKNGKEIFEGDILQSYPTQDVRFIVGFGVNGDNNSWGFTLESIGRKTVYSFETSVEKMEVIGNIYENPELLEEK